jgi:hypothetical protein
MRAPFISRRDAAHQRRGRHVEPERDRLIAQTRVPRRVSMQKETPKEIEMSTIQRFRTPFLATVVVVACTLVAPLAVTAEDQGIAAENQVILEEDQVPDLAPVAGPPWDETSGYGSLEASRATIGHPASTTQVPSDVRWAPARVIVPGSSVEMVRVLAAQHALESNDLGSMQEEALFAVVAGSSSWDETSGYGSLEASRAANALPDVPAASMSPDSIPAALASGQRAESAHLATVLLSGEQAVEVRRRQR